MFASLLASGCGDGADTPEDAAVHDVAPPPNDSAGTAADAGSSVPCSQGGNNRLRVTVSIDPTLNRTAGDIWLAARCGDGEQDRSVRVLRWNRDVTQTFDALGPGNWQVFASSFLSPGASSSRVTLSGNTTAAVPVTLQGGAAPIATLRLGGDSPNAYIVRSAGLDVAEIDITPPGVASPVGRLDLTLLQTPDGLLLTWLVRNTCAAAPCAALTVVGAEARTLDQSAPTDLSAARYDPAPIAAGGIQTFRPMLLRGQLPDASHPLALTLFGVIQSPQRSTP